jgi:hypothetical protein
MSYTNKLVFAVKAHKGWDKNKSPVNYALTVSLEILGANILFMRVLELKMNQKFQFNNT